MQGNLNQFNVNEMYSAISKQENAHREEAHRERHQDAYKALPHPPFGKSEHNLIYNKNLKQQAPVTRSIKKWSDEADAKIQDRFASTFGCMLTQSRQMYYSIV
jgi:hypothetical protein